MKVVIAPDKFRGSLTASEAAAAMAAGVRRAHPDADIAVVPVADGGDGTVQVALTAGYTPVSATVSGPTGEPVDAVFARRGDTAIIEMAEASGLRRLSSSPTPRDALTASSFGTGQLISAALTVGARRIVIGVGGSASTDGGTGIARALGVRFLNSAGQPIAWGGAGLGEIATINTSALDPRVLTAELIIATDVDNPLAGENGAAHIYAPQKGADHHAVEVLDAGLRHLAAIIESATGSAISEVAGAGAAGGVAATALPLLGASIAAGSELILGLLGLDQAVADAALVITGEGTLDGQSLRGKAPHGVARISAIHHVPCIAIAGRVQAADADLAAAGISHAYSLSDIEPDPARCMNQAAVLVTQLAEQASNVGAVNGTARGAAAQSLGADAAAADGCQ
jgi:glycerate kinase